MAGAATDSDVILRYRHSKHVGNHGDVLKHCILVQLINESLSDGNIHVVDTHAGTGGYIVPTDGECKDGIMRLLRLKRESQLSQQGDEIRGLHCSALREYLAAVMAVDEHLTGDREDEPILGYPGSPLLVRFLQNEVRESQRAILSHYAFELNRSQFSLLKQAMDSFEDCHDCKTPIVECDDGYERAPILLQKLIKDSSVARSIVLIDPPFKEIFWECQQVSTTVQELLRIDPKCTIMVWIPILETPEGNHQLKSLLSSIKQVAESVPTGHWCCATLQVAQEGLRGSSVWIANPPGQLGDSIEPVLPWLSKYLEQDAASFRWESG